MPEAGPSSPIITSRSLTLSAKRYGDVDDICDEPRVIRGMCEGTIDIKPVNNGVIFFPASLHQARHYYPVPPWLQDESLLRIDIAEEGGGECYGTSSVVCDVRGRPLKPFNATGNTKPNGLQGLFSTPESVIKITSYTGGAVIDFIRYDLVWRLKRVAHLTPTRLGSMVVPTVGWFCPSCQRPTSHPRMTWKSNALLIHECSSCGSRLQTAEVKLPPEFEPYREAVIAARHKSTCFGCRCIHFRA